MTKSRFLFTISLCFYLQENKMVNNSTNTQNLLDLKKLKDEDLSSKLKIAQETKNYTDMIIYAWEIQRRSTPEINEFEEKQKEMEEKIKSWTMTKEEMQDYFLNDIKNFKSEVNWRLNSADLYKDKQIADLQKQLEWSITDLPSMTEYFSLERRRLVNFTKKIQKFKQDKSNYPKNFLIYCMAMTNTKIFGTREAVKRTRIKMLRKFKNNDIKWALEILDKKLEPNKDDSKNRQILKELLKKEVQEAKTIYVEWVKKSVWI